MNPRVVRAIAHRDLLVTLRTRQVALSILLAPVVMMLVIPGLLALALTSAPMDADRVHALVARAPAWVQDDLAPFPAEAQPLVFLLRHVLAPLYLVVPLMVAHVLAADTFAGERERRTLEALVHSPVTDAELLAGKLASAWLPSVLIAWVSFLVYALAANAFAWPLTHALVLPTPAWWVLALWVSPAVAAFSLAFMILVSARARTFLGAYQTGGLVLAPVLALFVWQLLALVQTTVLLALVLGAAFMVAAGALLAFGRRFTTREGLLTAAGAGDHA